MRALYFLSLILIMFAVSSYAGDKAYVSDSFSITLRAGPGTDYKILAFLPSGEPLQIISTQGDWTKVKPLNPRYKSEGWVLTSFIMARKPCKLILKNINKENSRLKQEVADLTKGLNEKIAMEKTLTEKLKNLSAMYQEVKAKYDTLKRDASDYLDLKARYEKTKKILEQKKSELKRLKKENEYLKRSQAHRWFLMGAFVLFSGVLLGLILGRQRSKRRSLYY